MTVANTFAARGVATIGIDIPFHGGRDVTATDLKGNFTGAAGPDGFAEVTDSPAFAFFDTTGDRDTGAVALDPSVIRSAFLQAAIDLMQQTRVISGGDLSAIGKAEPRLAALSFRHDAVAYTSESFGSMIGAVLLAAEPRIGAAVLDVGGGGLIFPLLINSAVFGPIFGSLLDGALGTSAGDDPLETDFSYNLMNALLEAGDALANAPYVIRHPLAGASPKHVLQPSAHLDELVPNIANEALARALGLQPVDLTNQTVDLTYWPMGTSGRAPVSGNIPVGGSTVTGGFIQFEPAAHSMMSVQQEDRSYDLSTTPYRKLSAPTTIQNPTARLQAIVGDFLADFYAGRTPTITNGQ
jgi:hypothetical protein